MTHERRPPLYPLSNQSNLVTIRPQHLAGYQALPMTLLDCTLAYTERSLMSLEKGCPNTPQARQLLQLVTSIRIRGHNSSEQCSITNWVFSKITARGKSTPILALVYRRAHLDMPMALEPIALM
jgi:hypothetical protein